MKTLVIVCSIIFTVYNSIAGIEPNPDYLSVKIVSMDIVPIVEVRLNGKISFFVLDSGSDISLINQTALDYFNLNKSPLSSRDVKGFSGDRKGVYAVKGSKLTVGDSFINPSFYATDLNHLVQTIEKFTSISITGILGLDIMREHGFEIDYSNQVLRFHP